MRTDESQGAAKKGSGPIALRRRRARRIDNREYNLDNEDLIAPRSRASESPTKDKRDDEVRAGEKVQAFAKKLADFADGNGKGLHPERRLNASGICSMSGLVDHICKNIGRNR